MYLLALRRDWHLYPIEACQQLSDGGVLFGGSRGQVAGPWRAGACGRIHHLSLSDARHVRDDSGGRGAASHVLMLSPHRSERITSAAAARQAVRRGV